MNEGIMSLEEFISEAYTYEAIHDLPLEKLIHTLDVEFLYIRNSSDENYTEGSYLVKLEEGLHEVFIINDLIEGAMYPGDTELYIFILDLEDIRQLNTDAIMNILEWNKKDQKAIEKFIYN